MPITDNDLQVLEEWLDGELTEEQGALLRQRMAMEPALSGALERLRDERNLRSRLFTVLEPGERETEVFCADLRRELRREDVWGSRMRGMRKIASLAAMITIVFMAGWISRERLTTAGRATAGDKMVVRDAVPLHPNNNVQLAGLLGRDEPVPLQFSTPGRIDLSGIPVARGEKPQIYIMRDPASGRAFLIQNIDPRALPQPFQPQNMPQIQPPPRQPQGQGVLVDDVRPVAR